MADEKEKAIDKEQETIKLGEGRKKELSQEELDKVAGGMVTGHSISSGGDRPSES